MHYSDGAFYRPLFENNMLQLQVATGCSHNKCAFCDMYKQPFKLSPRSEIIQDLDEIKQFGPIAHAFSLPVEMLYAFPKTSWCSYLGK